MYNSESLVSVIMTCYNARETLPISIASLLCQTYKNWELVFVDDGSDDGSSDFVESIGDYRFRIIKLERNFGRGIAYQKGHDEAHGEFVSILDADDWWYSTKLRKQISFLQSHDDVSLVGGGMIIVNETQRAVGYRCCHNIICHQMKRLVNPPLAFATICMRRKIIEKYSFNKNLKMAQDLVFLQLVCLNECYANLPEPLYAYSEYQSYNWEKAKCAWLFRIKALKDLRSKFPFQARKEIAKCWIKLLLYWIAHVFGFEKKSIANRSKTPTQDMLNIFFIERQKIMSMVAKIMKIPCTKPYL